MKRLIDLPTDEIFLIVVCNMELNNKFKEYIIDSDFMWLEEKIRCFKLSGIDFSYGLFGNNYMSVLNERDFLDGVEKSISNFSCTEKLKNLFNKTQKLSGTNLFNYYCEKLCDLYFEEEIKRVIDYLEDISIELDTNVFSGKNKDTYNDYLDCFISNGYLDKYYINENNELFKKL